MTQHNNTTQPSADVSGFAELGISKKLLTILAEQNITIPTPIQTKAIPVALTGQDVMGIAQTGTGKTLAFSLPLIQRIAKTQGTALIVAPTRELAAQIEETIQDIGKKIGLKSVVLIGGGSMHHQIQAIKRNPHVFIATPGRLIDHLEQGTIKLDNVDTVVLDEADRMLDMGFAPQIKNVMKTVRKERQTMLFSATMPPEIIKLASSYMHLPLRIEVAPAGTAAERVDQELFIVEKDKKINLLASLLGEYDGSVLVFSRTKHGAKKITQSLKMMDHQAAEIHSNKTLAQRRQALEGFKSGKYRVLVATDIAARGIDVTNIEVVINFDLPDNPDDYIHRIGRTGRAGLAGRAISFATPDQAEDIQKIERLMRRKIPLSQKEGISITAFSRMSSPSSSSSSGSGSQGRGGRGRRSSGGFRGSSAAKKPFRRRR